MKTNGWITAVICILALASPASCVTIRVDCDGGGDFLLIQEGVDAAADGDTVLVAAGTYSGDGNRDIDFFGKAITVRSEDGPEVTIIDCGATLYDRHRGFSFRNGETTDAKVDGFTIQNGYSVQGGGITLAYSSAFIENCIIRWNTAYDQGGGVFSLVSEPVLTNCTIYGNTAILGGGFAIWFDSSPIITNCTFSENIAFYNGGALHCYTAHPVITNCILWGDIPNEIYDLEFGDLDVTYSDIEAGWPGEGNIDEDPFFLDPLSGDFHLAGGSPCIDSGTPDGAPDHDIDGDPRPLDSGYDIGSDEFSSDLHVFLEDYPTTIMPGEILTFTAGIRNLGAETAYFDLAEMVVTGPLSVTTTLYTGDPVPVSPGQSISTLVSLYVPFGVPEDLYTVSVVIYSEGTVLAKDAFDIAVGEYGPIVWSEDFSEFVPSEYYVEGKAYWDSLNGYLVLTDARGEVGWFFNLTPVLSSTWKFEFDLKIGGGSGADGMVFAFVEDYVFSAAGGGSMGFCNAEGYGVEFDCYYNPSGDPNCNGGRDPITSNHVAIMEDGADKHLAYTAYSVEDNQWHHVVVLFDDGHINVAIDDVDRIDFTIPGFVPFLSHFGFTSGTGNAWNWHIIYNVGHRAIEQ